MRWNVNLKLLPRESIARPAIENNSYIAIMDSIEDMFTVMNEVAPEHLEIQLPDPMNYMSLVQNAGSVFLGAYASEPLGDYVGGTNHVLPTSGTARFSSPLGVYDFVKRTSFTQFTKERFRRSGKTHYYIGSYGRSRSACSCHRSTIEK